MTLNYQC